MRRSKSHRSLLSSASPASLAALPSSSPLRPCRLAAVSSASTQIRRRPRYAEGLPGRPAQSGCGAALDRLVARLPLQGTDRSGRGGADLQPRHRRGGRAHRAGRRASRASPARRCCRSSISTPARAQRASQSRQRRLQAVRDRRGRSTHRLQQSLSASYEIDFWGKNRAALRAAEDTAVASRFDREVVALTTVVSVVNSYFLVLAAQDRLRIARDNLAARDPRAQPDQAALRRRHRVRARHRAAGEPGRHPARRRSRRCEQQLRQNIATLAVLVGRPPEHVTVRGGSMSRSRMPPVTPGLPSDLLAAAARHPRGRGAARGRQCQRRVGARGVLPDHPADRRGRLSERRAAHAAPAGVGVLTLAAGLTQPIFDGCRLAGPARSARRAGRTSCCSSIARRSSAASPTSSAR